VDRKEMIHKARLGIHVGDNTRELPRERDNREWIMSSPGTLGRLMIHSPADAGCYPIDFLFILSFGYLHLQASKNEAMEVTRERKHSMNQENECQIVPTRNLIKNSGHQVWHFLVSS
jgi:hypothetical protein